MQSAKSHIIQIVNTYKKVFPEEYDICIRGIKAQRELHADKFGSAKLQGAPDMRALFEIPVTLNEMLVNNLDEEEMEWFKAGGANRKQGAFWFVKKFPEFSSPDTI